MKLKFEKHVLGSKLLFFPRAELTEDEVKAGKGMAEIALNRKGDGCIYSVMSFQAHDYDAPGWNEDGTSTNASVPTTAQQYMDRIVESLKVAGLEVTAVEVTEPIVHEHLVIGIAGHSQADADAEDAEGDEDEDGTWKKYGVN